jgi:hypothetical protein
MVKTVPASAPASRLHTQFHSHPTISCVASQTPGPAQVQVILMLTCECAAPIHSNGSSWLAHQQCEHLQLVDRRQATTRLDRTLSNWSTPRQQHRQLVAVLILGLPCLRYTCCRFLVADATSFRSFHPSELRLLCRRHGWCQVTETSNRPNVVSKMSAA